MIKPTRKSILMIFYLLIVLVISVVIIAEVTKNIIAESFQNKIVLINKEQPINISYDNLEVSFLNQSFRLNDVQITKDQLNENSTNVHSLASASTILAEDFELLPLLLHRNLIIDKINFDDLVIVLSDKKKKREEKKVIKKDSTKKKALNKLIVNEINFENYHLVQLAEQSNDSIVDLHGALLTLEGISLSQSKKSESQLVLEPEKLKITGNRHTLKFKDQEHMLELNKFNLDFRNERFQLVDFTLGKASLLPSIANSKVYNTPVNAFYFSELNGYGINTDSLFIGKSVLLDSLIIDKAAIDIFKNTNKPWNKDREILLPNQLLAKQQTPIRINEIKVKNSTLVYTELVGTDKLVIPIENLNLTIDHVASKGEYYKYFDSNTLNINLEGTLFKDIFIATEINFENPLNSTHFNFRGSTGSFNFHVFNPIMIPSSNIKFESGNVSRIEFNGYGNALESRGELLMRYSNLKTIVLREHATKENKTFTWFAKAVVRKENPKNGKLKVAKMNFRRVPYKGFGNYLFKTIESGLVNSVYPLGARKRIN